MNKLKLLGFVFIALLSMSIVQATILFEDDFEDGLDAGDWTVKSLVSASGGYMVMAGGSAWSVNQGAYTVDSWTPSSYTVLTLELYNVSLSENLRSGNDQGAIGFGDGGSDTSYVDLQHAVYSGNEVGFSIVNNGGVSVTFVTIDPADPQMDYRIQYHEGNGTAKYFYRYIDETTWNYATSESHTLTSFNIMVAHKRGDWRIGEIVLCDTASCETVSVTPTPFFDVTATDIDTSATLYNLTVTLENGTQYTNVTNSIVVTPFNDSSLQNFTVSVDNYFNQTFTNYNTSVDLQVNLSKYPLVYIYNEWTGDSINATVLIDGQTYYSGTSGVYVPYNESQTVAISKTNYFPQSLTHDFTSYTDLNTSLFQAQIKFQAFEFITNNIASPANFTIDGVTKTDSEYFYIDAGTYSVTFSSPSHFNKVVSFNVTALDNNTLNFTGVSGTVINVTATDLINTGSINTFSITISNDNYSYSEDYSTTNGWVTLSSLQDVAFNVTIDANGYALLNATITPNSSLFNYSFELYTTNSINITFKDTETDSIITTKNISVDFIGSVITYNESTSTGSLYVDLITPDAYVIRYSAEGYSESFYYFTMTNRTTQAVTVYLTNSSSTTDVTINVFDETNNDIEGALVKVLRFDVETGSYLQVEAKLTNFEGKTVIPITLNEEFYKFIIEYPVGTIVKTTQASYITGTTLNIQVQLSQSVAANFYKLTGVSYLITFDDSTNQFTYTYSDSSNTASKGCLNVYRVSVKEKTLVNSTCSNTAASSMILSVTNATGATYKADAVIYFGDEKQFLGSMFKTYSTEDLFGVLGLFALLIVTVFIVFVARWSLTATVLMLPLPMVGLRVLNIIPIGWEYIVGILGLALVIAYILGGRGK